MKRSFSSIIVQLHSAVQLIIVHGTLYVTAVNRKPPNILDCSNELLRSQYVKRPNPVYHHVHVKNVNSPLEIVRRMCWRDGDVIAIVPKGEITRWSFISTKSNIKRSTRTTRIVCRYINQQALVIIASRQWQWRLSW